MELNRSAARDGVDERELVPVDEDALQVAPRPGIDFVAEAQHVTPEFPRFVEEVQTKLGVAADEVLERLGDGCALDEDTPIAAHEIGENAWQLDDDLAHVFVMASTQRIFGRSPLSRLQDPPRSALP